MIAYKSECGIVYELADEKAGRRVRCKVCGRERAVDFGVAASHDGGSWTRLGCVVAGGCPDPMHRGGLQ
jgi:hypothetical protein